MNRRHRVDLSPEAQAWMLQQPEPVSQLREVDEVEGGAICVLLCLVAIVLTAAAVGSLAMGLVWLFGLIGF